MGVWRLSRAFKSVPLAWITFFSIHGKVGNQTAGGVQKKQVCPSFHLFRRHIFSNIFFSPKVYSNDKVNSNVVTVVVVAVLRLRSLGHDGAGINGINDDGLAV